MEGSKNAMYEQAGRSRGWTVGNSDDMLKAKPAPVAVAPAPVAVTPVPVAVPPVHMPEPTPMPMPMPQKSPATIPPPPVVVIPDMIDIDMDIVSVETYSPKEEMPKKMAMPKKDCETPVMAYVPSQNWQELYEAEQGFHRGTIFTELDLPWIGEGACRYE